MMNLLVLLIQLYLTYISIVNTLTLSLPLKSKKISLFLILKSIGTVVDFRHLFIVNPLLVVFLLTLIVIYLSQTNMD